MSTIVVCGLPAPQGSKRHVGRGILVESSKAVKPWREAVKWAYLQQKPLQDRAWDGQTLPMITGPVRVDITFTLPRPKSAPKSRVYPVSAPDIDKLCRSTFDALTQVGSIEDDSRIVASSQRKLYVGHPEALSHPGAVITIERMD